MRASVQHSDFQRVRRHRTWASSQKSGVRFGTAKAGKKMVASRRPPARLPTTRRCQAVTSEGVRTLPGRGDRVMSPGQAVSDAHRLRPSHSVDPDPLGAHRSTRAWPKGSLRGVQAPSVRRRARVRPGIPVKRHRGSRDTHGTHTGRSGGRVGARRHHVLAN